MVRYIRTVILSLSFIIVVSVFIYGLGDLDVPKRQYETLIETDNGLMFHSKQIYYEHCKTNSI